MAFLAFLLALVQFTLLGFGVTAVGSSDFKNLAFGLALLALGFLYAPASAFVRAHAQSPQ